MLSASLNKTFRSLPPVTFKDVYQMRTRDLSYFILTCPANECSSWTITTDHPIITKDLPQIILIDYPPKGDYPWETEIWSESKT